MLIGVDAGCLGVKDERLKVGVYQMAKNLLTELGKIDKENDYLLYSFYPIEKELLEIFGKRMKNIIVWPSRGWMKIWLPLRILKDKPEIFLALSQALPLKLPFSPPLRTIGFIYDLAFERFPKMYPNSLSGLKKNTKDLVLNSDLIFTFSESTKKDIIDFYGIDQEKIRIAYQGVVHRNTKKNFEILKPIQQVQGKQARTGRSRSVRDDNKEKYFLFVGALKPIKNVTGLISAFSYFIEKFGLDYSLYIVGGDMWLDPEIKITLDESPSRVQKRINFLGFVNNKVLVSLYKGATAFVSPSFYEGFGLTFLEAMSLGCPVIGSKSGSIPEIVSDCGILVNPRNTKETGEAMITMAKNPKLRQKCIKEGLKRSKEFSANKFAKKVLSLYEKET